MIRVYFDSDVINGIHAGKSPELARFIENNRLKLLIAYSQAHVSDKLPSKNVSEKMFWDDIDFLTEFANSRLLHFDDKKKYTIPCIATARQVLDEIEDNNKLVDEFSDIDNIIKFMEETSEELGAPEIGEMFKGLFDSPALNAIAPDWLQGETYKEQLQKAADYMSDLRNDPSTYKENQKIVRGEFGLPDYAGQWTEEVVDKIDIHLKSKEKYNDFFELVDSGFQDMEKVTRYSYFVQAYQMLNMVGYKADEIIPKKNKGLLNHLQDAIHSFYAAHCDYFVVMDKRLLSKSIALYEKFGITTKLIHPLDLIDELKPKLSSQKINEIVDKTIDGNPVDLVEEDGIIKSLYRIDAYWLDYFTHIQFEQYPDSGRSKILFTKMVGSYSNFMFYEEHDRVIRTVHNTLGIIEQTEAVIEKFKSSDPEKRFVEYFLPTGYVKLETDGGKFYLSIDLPGSK